MDTKKSMALYLYIHRYYLTENGTVGRRDGCVCGCVCDMFAHIQFGFICYIELILALS